MQLSDLTSKTSVQRWLQVGIPAAVGVLVVVLAWLAGPGLFGIAGTDSGAPVQAEVTKPAECSAGNPVESVTFSLGGKPREGTLNGCGHAKGERVEVGVPVDAPAEGPLTVSAADTSAGAQDSRGPIALVLLVFACFAGGTYAFLFIKGPGKLALLH
ncbi:hypothetical protein VSH64_43225 [Amycolatopsis rhabdoformis]|uniref:Uncharacterized protein n=1 Tax=Amycolatopsis rhabdoformis TaxID=1448059 RepID=A0ABZ1I7N0_9PSEU|nr:hypothetical protein [Amycolatopsis rhabdoformis]WSE29543.1 hypothetical protein VSH64_43225 [Amycolatopsis rhabdoformis]